MSDYKFLSLYKELLELAESQKKALIEERLDDAAVLQEKRQRVIDKIQNIDSQALSISSNNLPVGRNDHAAEDFSRKIRVNIEKILSIDEEIKTIIKEEQGSLTSLLDSIRRAKTVCRKAIYHHDGDLLNISA